MIVLYAALVVCAAVVMAALAALIVGGHADDFAGLDEADVRRLLGPDGNVRITGKHGGSVQRGPRDASRAAGPPAGGALRRPSGHDPGAATNANDP